MVGLLFALAGCTEGPLPETLVDDLTVVAVVPESPEVAPGEVVAFDVEVAEPTGGPVDLMLWSCLPTPDGGCFEEAGEERVALLEGVESGELSLEYEISSNLSLPLAGTGGEVPLFIWSLACEPGLCPVAEGGDEGVLEEEFLANPVELLRELPFDGVSLALRSVWLSDTPKQERRSNPVVTQLFAEPQRVGPGDVATLAFEVEGEVPVEAFGYSTEGGFGELSALVSGGAVELEWIAPLELDEPRMTTVWVVFQAEDGGTAVWSGEWEIGG